VRVEEHLIIRSWFVVLLLRDENKSYINLMYAQKPKKSFSQSKEGNKIFFNPGIYSCAVDAFLEVSAHLYSLNIFWQIASSPPRAANRIAGADLVKTITCNIYSRADV